MHNFIFLIFIVKEKITGSRTYWRVDRQTPNRQQKMSCRHGPVRDGFPIVPDCRWNSYIGRTDDDDQLLRDYDGGSEKYKNENIII